jgi:DNA polymerase III subunit epsilon
MQLKDYPQLELIHIVKGLSTFLSLYDQPNVFALMMDYDIRTEQIKALASEHHCGYNTALITLILEHSLQNELKAIGAIKQSEPEPQPEPVAVPDQYRIVQMERAATKNSNSPMWRCMTDTGERVNVFEHSDPAKDTFHLFKTALYGGYMQAMKVGDVLEWNAHPIVVEMKKKGEWWEITNVLTNEHSTGPDEPTQTPDATAARNAAIQWAADLVENPFLIFDTETTGVQEDDEIVRIAIIDQDGNVKLDQLICPTDRGIERLTQKDPKRGIAPQDIHGITPEMLKEAPSYEKVREDLWWLLDYSPYIIAYNADYDVKMLNHVEKAYYSKSPSTPMSHTVEADCAMKQYSAFAGEWNSFQKNWKWHKLAEACQREGLPLLAEHDPVNDCKMTLALIQRMAAAKPGNSKDIPF